MVARGAKRPRSELRGLLQAFQPLLLSWSGQAELKTLREGRVARRPAAAARLGAAVRLLPQRAAAEAPAARGSASAALRRVRARRSAQLAGGAEQAPLLRRFELALLAELGYALPLTREADTGAPIDPAARYHYAFDRGPQRARGRRRARAGPLVRGATLLALAERTLPRRRDRGARPSA